MLTTRIITNEGDPLVDGNGNPLAGARVEFYLINAARQRVDAWDVISGEYIAPGPVHVFTDSNGEFSIPLWPTSRGDQVLYWYCHVDYDGMVDFFAPLTDGPGPVQWIDFKFGGVAPTPTQYDVLTAHIADANLHFNWRGDYVHGTQYYHYDAVQFAGSTWKAKIDNINIDPPENPATTSATWALLAAMGNTGTVEIGTVTTGAPGSSATVENVGTPSAAILDFAIPQGATGATGPGNGGFTLVSSFASLTAAVASIGGTVTNLLLDAPTSLTADTTIPPTMQIMGTLKGTVARNGHALTINGIFAAGEFQVFTGTGSVSGLVESRPVWFGWNAAASTATNRAALQDAVSGVAVGGTVFFGTPGRYSVSKYTYVYQKDRVTFEGVKGAVIIYPSADLTVVDDATTFADGQARSAFFVVDSDDVTFRGLSFEGNSTEVDIFKNIGVAIYFRQCQNPTLFNCRNSYGGSMWNQDATTDDFGLTAIDCVSYGYRGNHTCGPEANVHNCRFELPTSTDYDRIGNNGSTHAIYFFAGRNNSAITGCLFKNIRTDGVKVSGTSLPIYSILISGCRFIDCGGGVEAGADDTQVHANISIVGSEFVDCGTNRAGWTNSYAVRILGAYSVDVSHNQFYYTRIAVTNVAAIRTITVSRFGTPGGSPVENAQVTHNQIHAVAGLTPSLIVTYAIEVVRVGEGSSNHGSCLVAFNDVFGVGGTAFHIQRCICPVLEGNNISNVATAVVLEGNRMPILRKNLLIPTSVTSSNAQIRIIRDSWPILSGNIAMGRTTGTPGQSMTVSASGGSSAVDFPLLGTHGRVVPAAGKKEVVFAFGDGWTDGDTITVASTTLAYMTSISDALTQFNSPASLIALIDAIANIDAADYGAPWSITTDHIRVRNAAANGADFEITRNCANQTAAVLLMNGTGGTLLRSVSRGGQAAPGSLSLIWSPLATFEAATTLIADNAAAATLLKNNGYYPSGRSVNDTGTLLQIEHGSIAGTEEFRWAILQ